MVRKSEPGQPGLLRKISGSSQSRERASTAEAWRKGQVSQKDTEKDA